MLLADLVLIRSLDMHVERLHGRQARLAKMVVYEHNKPGQQKCIVT